ncbi:hypothetical protein BN10_740015 [Phycicoccus elongatus Lp2]|uniref:Uncharacterized protein n=2 Tax=Phycicoccus elongatus TaxID=101689 RepID=N0E218_9MICO|nr:hypothetical protein BN10_740015 [Phycicoccus elongatus Lp2]
MPSLGESGIADPVLCVPFLDTGTLVRRMSDDLARFTQFDPARNAISPTETSAAAEVAIMARMSVLLRVYSDDYHTDSFDIERLAAQMRAGTESIWFWGEAEQIGRLRNALTDPPYPLPSFDVGTVTVLSAEGEFGPGHGELCRSGSTDPGLGATAPILSRSLQYHLGEETYPHDRYHTLVLAARNRASTDKIRGGEALQRIHSRYVQSRFWGYVPFYVMQGGVLEQTELRESNRDPLDVVRALRDQPVWHFADDREARFAASLVELNFGFPQPVTVDDGSETADSWPGFVSTLPPSPALVPNNHASLRIAAEGGASLDATVAEAIASGVCCVAVRLPLSDPFTSGVQRWLRAHGFNLSAVCPPKDTWYADPLRHDVQTPAYGIWVRPRPGLVVIPPHYAQRLGAIPAESEVLRYHREVLSPRWASFE